MNSQVDTSVLLRTDGVDPLLARLVLLPAGRQLRIGPDVNVSRTYGGYRIEDGLGGETLFYARAADISSWARRRGLTR